MTERPLDAMPVAVTGVLLERLIFLELDFPACALPGRHRIFTNVIGESKAHRKHRRVLTSETGTARRAGIVDRGQDAPA